MNKFIITYTPFFKKNVLNELKEINKNIDIIKEFDKSVFLIETKLKTEIFIKKIIKKSPIFIKHMMPVLIVGEITGNLDIDKKIIYQQSTKVVELPKNIPFAVQCRIINGGINGLEWTSKDIEVFVGTEYANMGAIPSFSDYNLENKNIKIISILINENEFYLGFSNSKENLNFHCDEYRICSKKARTISRAENKLKEALVKYDIKLTGTGYALDVGAAPGGWTKVLADYGYNVFAIDPADLNPELYKITNIKHFKCKIEDIKFNNFFDIIVNDMNVEPQITAQIMNDLAPTLKNNSLAIITLKITKNSDKIINEATTLLKQKYHILKMNNLFHNRQEITVLMQKK